MKTKKTEKKNIYNYLCEIEDYRRKEGRRFELPMVLLIVLMSVMSGFSGERAMWDFVKKNEKDLRKYLKPKKWRLPSYQTIDSILTTLWYEKIIDKFIEWATETNIIEKWEFISLDWKVMRWTGENKTNSRQKFISVVSAFRNRNKEVIWTQNINSWKESEIPAVRKLIEMLWLKWVVFTADALHCQKETLKTIKESWNDYVIWVKWNQPKLQNIVKKQTKKKACDKYKLSEKK